jgi:hypothetical protein
MIITAKNISKTTISDFPAKYQEHYQDVKDAVVGGLYALDNEVKTVIDAFFSKIVLENSSKEAKTDSSVKKVNVSTITIDKKRFQNRSKLNQTVLNSIVENYNPTILDPLIVWKEKGKTFLLAGHHRLEATKIKKIKNIAVKYFTGTEAEAINFARVESNANRSLETPIERAKIYREFLENGESKANILEKAKKIEGKNANYIINLSYLKPNGVVIANLEALENADKQNIAIIEKVADWIGQAFRNYHTLLTSSHEKEMYDFLVSKDSLRIKTKVEFLQKINSIVSAFDYKSANILNLKRFKYVSEGESIYDEEYNLIKEKINSLIDKKAELKNRFNNPNSKDFIDPKSSYYTIAVQELDKQVAKINEDLQFNQNQLIKLQSNKANYVNAGSNQGALFGVFKKPPIQVYLNMPTVISEIPVAFTQIATGLNAVENNIVSPEPFIEQVQNIVEDVIKVVKNKNNPFRSTAEKAAIAKPAAKLYNLKNQHLATLLGNIEIKPKQSLVITLDSKAGGGKTHTCYQMAQAFAESGYKPILWSLEEHEESNLAEEKKQKYFNSNTKQIISVESEDTGKSDEENYNKIVESIKYFDVILIDSLTKVIELNKKFKLDKDFRKAFDGKLFILIVQRTSDGKMRGGSSTGFDGDIILKVEVDEDGDFRKNFIYNDKNRYNDYAPLSDLKYSPYSQELVRKEPIPVMLNN